MTTNVQVDGCAIKAQVWPKPSKIAVNGVVISRDAIARETQNHPAERPIEAWQAAARALVVRELLLQEARRLGLQPVPISDDDGRRETDEEALIRQLIDTAMTTPISDETACRTYYTQNRRRFRSADLAEVRHILLAAAPGDKAARAAKRAQAEAVVARLKADPSAFGTIAKDISDCPSSEMGGNLGQIGPGQTVPEFEQALAKLVVGDVAPEPVESRYGFHIVRVERRIDGQELPFDLVRERIARWLDDRVRHTAIRQYLAILAGRATITGIDIAASPSPLVQ